jgi:hypothetical protein
MKTFLIILGIAFVMVLGQVLMLRPSARDKALIALREAARQQGLNPRLMPRPEWLRVEPDLRLVACYSVFVEEGGQGLPHWLAERQNDGEWVERIGKDVLAGLELPGEAAALLAVEARSNSLSLYWTESLGPEALPVLSRLLFNIAEKLKTKQ